MYVEKINKLIAKIAKACLIDNESKVDIAEVENSIVKQSIIINKDIIDRHDNINKSFEYEYHIIDDEDEVTTQMFEK